MGGLSIYPFERFSEDAKRVLTIAQAEAEAAHHSWIGTEHMLLALIRHEHGLAGSALKAMNVDDASTRAKISIVLETQPQVPIQQIIPTSRVKRVIEMAFEEARDDGSSTVDTGHMLLALRREGDGIAAQILQDRGITVERIRQELDRLKRDGKVEKSRTNGKPLKRLLHLDLTDPQGRSLSVDVLFPVEYSSDEEKALSARVREAVEGQK